MSDQTPFGFGKFIPGFDFLQNLSKAGQSSASMPPLSHWVAPTVSIEEISKRIEELKAVQFWLEQNSRALAATVQALEVQKMTLSTLQGMNVSMADLAKTFTSQAAPAAAEAAAAAAASAHAGWPMSSSARKPEKTVAPKEDGVRSAPDFEAKPAPEAAQAAEPPRAASAQASAAPGMADPMLWWGALSQQFQQIASQALQDPAQQQAVAQATHMASDFTKAAMHAASSMVRQASEGVQQAASTAAQAAAQTVSQATAPSGKKATATAPATPRNPQAATQPSAAPKAPAARKTPAAATKAAGKAAAKKTAAVPRKTAASTTKPVASRPRSR